MRLNKARIPPVSDAEAIDEQRALFAPLSARGPVLNIFRTMARKPEALRSFLEWGNYILSRKNSLSARTRELAILRTGFNCIAGYEWAQHVVIGRRAGLEPAEIARIKRGPADPDWSAADRAVLTACDDLTSGFFITDATWAALRAEFSEVQCMDLVYTVGQYTQVSMLLNSFGVQPDAGLEMDPALDRAPG